MGGTNRIRKIEQIKDAGNGKTWDGKRYHTLNHFLREKFGGRYLKYHWMPVLCPTETGKCLRGCIFAAQRIRGFAGTSEDMSNFMKSGDDEQEVNPADTLPIFRRIPIHMLMLK